MTTYGALLMHGFEKIMIFLTSFSTPTSSHYSYKSNKIIVCASWFLRSSPSGNRPGPQPGRGGAARWWRCWSGRGLRRCICGPLHQAERRPAPDIACTQTSPRCKTSRLNRVCTEHEIIRTTSLDTFHTHTPFIYPTYPIILCVDTEKAALWGLISMTSQRIFRLLHLTKPSHWVAVF